MDRKILKTISTKEDLDLKILNSLDLGIEIQDFVEPNLTQEEIEETINFYRNCFKKFKGIRSLHGPFLDLKPASPDKLIRQVSYSRYLNTLKIANELEMDYIIFHSQINPYLNQPNLRKLNNRQAKEFWVKILDEIKCFNGIILLENIFEDEPYILKELIEAISISNIKINLDIGHAKLGKVSLETWIRELREYIAYIHVHSNDGLYDLHKSPSSEEINNLYSLLDKYNINPVLSLEYNIENLEQELTKYK